MTVTILANDYGGAQTPTAQVVHSAETPLQRGYAVAIGKMFARVTGKSAHRMVDPGTDVLCVPLDRVAWHCGPMGNGRTIGYEQAGYARYTRAEWTTPDGLSQLRLLAMLIAADAERYGIPDRWLTDAQLRRWYDGGKRLADGGRVTHDQVHRVLGGTTHTDPMPWYPLDLLGAAITQARAGRIPTPTPPEDDVSAADVWAAPIKNPDTGAVMKASDRLLDTERRILATQTAVGAMAKTLAGMAAAQAATAAAVKALTESTAAGVDYDRLTEIVDAAAARAVAGLDITFVPPADAVPAAS